MNLTLIIDPAKKKLVQQVVNREIEPTFADVQLKWLEKYCETSGKPAPVFQHLVDDKNQQTGFGRCCECSPGFVVKFGHDLMRLSDAGKSSVKKQRILEHLSVHHGIGETRAKKRRNATDSSQARINHCLNSV